MLVVCACVGGLCLCWWFVPGLVVCACVGGLCLCWWFRPEKLAICFGQMFCDFININILSHVSYNVVMFTVLTNNRVFLGILKL